MTIVKTPDELTATWLTEALGEPVSSFTLEPVGTGQMGDSFRVELDSGRTVILKVAAADETSRATGLALRIFEVEVSYYLELAEELGAPVPQCFFGEVEVETGWFTLLLEDMAPAVQGDQLDGCELDQAQLSLLELARLHASGWERADLAAKGWLNRNTTASTEFTTGLVSSLFPGFLERYDADLTPTQKQICSTFMDHLGAYLSTDGPRTVIHGDYRLDNLLFEKADRVTVVDWQTVTWGHPMVDVAYFLACALADPAERAAHEQDLVKGYHDELVRNGVRTFPWEDCWRGYRAMTFTTLLMAIASSMLVERTERGDRMFLCSIERASAQIDHLNALELLP